MKPKYGICKKYVKTIVVNEKPKEVVCKCKEHGIVNESVEFERS